MTTEQKRQRSLLANKVRWDKERDNPYPKAMKSGVLVLGDIQIPCAVLADGRRVLSETGVRNALGSRGAQSVIVKKQSIIDGAEIPVFLAATTIKPLVIHRLSSAPFVPIKYRRGIRVVTAYPAEILPEVCEIWLDARDKGMLRGDMQAGRAQKAEMLMRALAKVGITALVDEATGYQEERDRTELQKLLSKYINEEYMKWQARFPRAFYRELFRLFGWKFDPSSVKRPALLGKFTNDYVYSQLPPGILDELRDKNPVVDSRGTRKKCHHQFLTSDIGIPHLDKHITNLLTLMRASKDLAQFKELYATLQSNSDIPVVAKSIII